MNLRSNRPKLYIIFVLVVFLFLTLIIIASKQEPSTLTYKDAVQAYGYYYSSDQTGNFEIYMGQNEGKPKQITSDSRYDSWWPRISPDESRLIFYRTPKGVHDQDYSKTSLWLMDTSSGGHPTQIIANNAFGWHQHGHAEWSPNGTKLVMFAGTKINPQLWLTDANGRDPKKITNHGGVNLDPSWSPDGTKIVYIACPNNVCLPSDQEVYTIETKTGSRSRITSDDIRDQDPYFSHDGTEIAFLSQMTGASRSKPAGVWEIRIQKKDGSIDTTKFGQVTSLPTWSSDGRWLYTHQLVYGDKSKFNLVRINRNDLQSADLLHNTVNNEEYISLPID
ncbi:MAG: hypothetical protein AAB459_01480 [Patescibacteria group bacterium]